jgi:hypothetical protein
MDINRDNYEGYFLLYADNELTDSEKVAVILFLKENKDLEDEFRMIHHTISKPEIHVSLNDKSFLLKNNRSSFINETNDEEIFVLYHDDELTTDQKAEVEEFVFRHSSLQNEFELIGIARLTPEKEVVFPNKKVLYQREKVGKILPIIFWRMIAAAVFIGFGLWITTFFYQKNTINSYSSKGNELPAIKDVPIIKKILKPSKDSVSDSHLLTENYKAANNVRENEKEKIQRPLLQNKKNIIAKNRLSREKSRTALPAKTGDELVIDGRRTNDIPSKEMASLSKVEPEIQSTQKVIDKNSDKIEPAMHAQTVSYIPNEKENSQNYVFYNVTTEEFRKTKVGGFLKKVKRVIERTNPVGRLLSGEDRQVVSN